MTAFVRLVAFVVSALGAEVARGAGLATLVVAAFAGAWRINPLCVIVVAVAGSVLSLALPDDAGTSGKVAHSLSNVPFVLLLHAVLGGGGYVAGRILRRLARR